MLTGTVSCQGRGTLESASSTSHVRRSQETVCSTITHFCSVVGACKYLRKCSVWYFRSPSQVGPLPHPTTVLAWSVHTPVRRISGRKRRPEEKKRARKSSGRFLYSSLIECRHGKTGRTTQMGTRAISWLRVSGLSSANQSEAPTKILRGEGIFGLFSASEDTETVGITIDGYDAFFG